MIAAGVSGLSWRRALPALIVGSSVFLQVHLVLGLLLGPLAVRAFNEAKGPALIALAVLVAATLLFWRARRRKRAAPAAWIEATCPVCIGATMLASRVPALAQLTETAPASPAGTGRERGYSPGPVPPQGERDRDGDEQAAERGEPRRRCRRCLRTIVKAAGSLARALLSWLASCAR